MRFHSARADYHPETIAGLDIGKMVGGNGLEPLTLSV